MWHWFEFGRLRERLRRYVDSLKFGRGGSSAFAGIFEDRADHWEPGAILLGTSLQEPFRQVGWKDERGFMTIAARRAGKDRNAIIPNLLTWPGSALVIDPKGTHAAITAARRGFGGGRVTEFLGQEVHVVDPFKIVPGVTCSRFNPLAAIDPASAQFTEVVGQVADALVIADKAGEPSHWDECARMLIAGIIAFLLQKQQGATLVDLRRALTRKGIESENLFKEMHLGGGLATTAAAMMRAAGPNEREAIFARALRSTEWLESHAMQDTLSSSDFDIRDIKQTGMTVYVVLPPHFLEVHNRFMRLFVNLAVCAVSIGEKPQHPVLFVLDEFWTLGRMSLIEQSGDLFAGYGLKLWLFIQHIGQLKHVYGKNWEAFIANVGAVQAFSVNDSMTAEFLISHIGKSAGLDQIGPSRTRVLEELREMGEGEHETGKQIIFRSGELPMLLKRTPYDMMFPKSWYNPDPGLEGTKPADQPTP